MVERRRPNGRAAPEPVRVFVGTSPGGQDAEACLVVEASLRARCTAPAEVTWLAPQDDPSSPLHGWPAQGWGTPWAGLRWAVPALAGWWGRAVYLDCPQVVVGDAAALAAAEMPPEAAVLVRREGAGVRTAVMVWDCAVARKFLPPLEELRREVGAHQRLSAALVAGSRWAGELPAGWDVRDAEFSHDPSRATGSAHFASAALQPHQGPARARLREAGARHWFTGTRLPHFCPEMIALWEAEHDAALAAGYDVGAYVPGEDRSRSGTRQEEHRDVPD